MRSEDIDLIPLLGQQARFVLDDAILSIRRPGAVRRVDDEDPQGG
jgi:hypothetical protein